MVKVVKGGGRAPRTLSNLGKFFHLPLCVFSVTNAMHQEYFIKTTLLFAFVGKTAHPSPQPFFRKYIQATFLSTLFLVSLWQVAVLLQSGVGETNSNGGYLFLTILFLYLKQMNFKKFKWSLPHCKVVNAH